MNGCRRLQESDSLEKPYANGQLFVCLFVIMFKHTYMKKQIIVGSLLSSLLFLTSCKAIGAIFKAGMWWGIILVVLVIAVIIWIFGKIMGGK